jgi:type II secretory pathway component PulC
VLSVNFVLNKFYIKKAISLALIFGAITVNSQTMNNINTNLSLTTQEQLTLTNEWDKVFPKSDISMTT